MGQTRPMRRLDQQSPAFAPQPAHFALNAGQRHRKLVQEFGPRCRPEVLRAHPQTFRANTGRDGMTLLTRRILLTGLLTAPLIAPLSACGRRRRRTPERVEPAYRDSSPLHPNETPELRALIEKYAALYEVPVALVQRVIIRESTHNPRARNGPYYGLMQILPQTAGTMGFRGQPSDLLDAETNLKYAVKYLRGAWLLSDGDQQRAIFLYAKGFYPEAKARGLLVETGLKPAK